MKTTNLTKENLCRDDYPFLMVSVPHDEEHRTTLDVLSFDRNCSLIRAMVKQADFEALPDCCEQAEFCLVLNDGFTEKTALKPVAVGNGMVLFEGTPTVAHPCDIATGNVKELQELAIDQLTLRAWNHLLIAQPFDMGDGFILYRHEFADGFDFEVQTNCPGDNRKIGGFRLVWHRWDGEVETQEISTVHVDKVYSDARGHAVSFVIA